MPLLSKVLIESTGLSEKECVSRLGKFVREDRRYEFHRNLYGTDILPEAGWGFITLVLGSDPETLIGLLKKEK